MKKLFFAFALVLCSTFVLCSASAAAQDACEDGFVSLFNGKDLTGWAGAMQMHEVKDGTISFIAGPKNYGNLMYDKKFKDFILRFEFKLFPGTNNGLGIRASEINKDAAYYGMELQIADETGFDKNAPNPPETCGHHGSIYGVYPALRGAQKPLGEWNFQEVECVGPHVKVTLNGIVILDTDISGITQTFDGKDHPGLHNAEGYIGFLGHTKPIQFRNIRIKEL